MKYNSRLPPTLIVAMAIQKLQPAANKATIAQELGRHITMPDIIIATRRLIDWGIIWGEWETNTRYTHFHITSEARDMIQELSDVYEVEGGSWWQRLIKRFKK